MSKQEAIDKGYWNPDWKTVPQLWLYDKHIGGYTEYMQYKEQNGAPITNFPTEITPDYKDCASCEA
jgi:glutaredoxin-related protein